MPPFILHIRHGVGKAKSVGGVNKKDPAFVVLVDIQSLKNRH